MTRCAVADHFGRHDLGPLCERTMWVEDERVARVFGEPAGISAGPRSAGAAIEPPRGS